MTDRTNIVGAIATEIDRLVIAGHDLASAYPDKPAAVVEMTAFPQMLSTISIVLLAGPIRREEFGRIIPFTPPSLVNALVDNNVTEGIVSESDGAIVLTETGRAIAEGIVEIQEASIGEVWGAEGERVERLIAILAPIVERARASEPARTPSNFMHFASVFERPSPPGVLLRLITAIRYWRADAHLAAIDHAGLHPSVAHALSRLWDTHRDVIRVGQGFPNPGSKGVAVLEERGLASGGVITSDGIALRDQIEQDTDRRNAALFESLDEAAMEGLLGDLQMLPRSR
ncbi:MAG: hypothetical protein WD826_06490 [Actinomycetota bacterium]